MADGYVDGVRYGVPWYGGFGCLFYRTDLFAQAGVEPPATWEGLLEVCRVLRDKTGLEYPFAFNPRAGFWMMPWVWQTGAMIMTPDCRTVTTDTPEFVEAVQFVHDLMHKYGVSDPSLALGTKPQDLWSTGAAAMSRKRRLLRSGMTLMGDTSGNRKTDARPHEHEPRPRTRPGADGGGKSGVRFRLHLHWGRPPLVEPPSLS